MFKQKNQVQVEGHSSKLHVLIIYDVCVEKNVPWIHTLMQKLFNFKEIYLWTHSVSPVKL